MCVYVNVHICVFISIPQNPQTLHASVPLHMLFAQLSARVASSSLVGLGKSYA